MGLASGGAVTAAAVGIGPALDAGPFTVGAVVLAVVATGGYLLLRFRNSRTPGKRLRRALGAVDEVAVLTHPNPDPDALACALAVRELAASVDTSTTIYYPGEIRHEENLALVEELDIEATRLRDASDIANRDVVLVDHNQPRGFAGAGGVDAYAVIDHHPGEAEATAFTDIRSDYGACASLLAEYLRELGWGADDGGRDTPAMSESLATALVYGIRSDTAGFTRGCTAAEFDAAAYCSERADPDTIQRVANPPVSPERMDVRARAVLNRVQRGAFVCTHAGEVPSPDAVAQAADDLLRMKGTRAVVVAGRCDGTLHLSGRAIEGSVDIGETLSTAIEGIPMADAGGHARMGGGQLSVEHMAGLGPGDGVSIERFFESVFAVMASQDPEGAPDKPAEPVAPGAVAASEADPVPPGEADRGDVGDPVDRPEASGGD
ncbi:DHH family phosphoesterase [Haloglomus litoreum]|uniref:DHH family phosphoesterase n=1 Tax=Haloglomus litoreum TaxID=3034026 RepID=UPI0023E79358|nr:bifunctional oligoribonuclease/PAP phosphatase NrnA [Haloglomus sp. DT116]